MVDAKIQMTTLGELRHVLQRATNTMDPHTTPEWIRNLMDPFCSVENFPDSSIVVLLIADEEK